jgi:hypothetical protein
MTNDETRAEVLAKLAEIHRIADGGVEWVLEDHGVVRGRIRTLARQCLDALATVPPQPATCVACAEGNHSLCLGGKCECIHQPASTDDSMRNACDHCGTYHAGQCDPYTLGWRRGVDWASAGPEVETLIHQAAEQGYRSGWAHFKRGEGYAEDDAVDAICQALTRAAPVSAPTPCAGRAEKDAKLEIQKADRDSWRRVAESIQAAATKAEQARDTAEAKLREAQAEIERLKAIADVTDLTDGQPISFAALCDSIDSKRLTDQVYDLIINHIRRREAAEARCAELKQKALEMRGIIANGMDGWDSIDVGRAQKVLDDPEFKDG